MGIFQRASRRSTDRFWRGVQLFEGEVRIDYAHLRWVIDGAKPDELVTCYLTDARLVVALPTSAQRAFNLESDFLGVEPGFLADEASLRLWTPMSGQPGVAAPIPLAAQRPQSSANRALAASFLDVLYRRLVLANPNWAERTPEWLADSEDQ